MDKMTQPLDREQFQEDDWPLVWDSSDLSSSMLSTGVFIGLRFG